MSGSERAPALSDVDNAGEPSALPRISYIVPRLDRALRKRLGVVLAPHGLSLPQYTVMSVLGRRADLSNAQLARRAYISPQAMNEVMRSLEDRELVERHPSPDHGRVRPARLTKRGSSLLTTCERDVEQMEQGMLAAFTDPERLDLATRLMACVAALDVDPPDEMTDRASVGR